MSRWTFLFFFSFLTLDRFSSIKSDETADDLDVIDKADDGIGVSLN